MKQYKLHNTDLRRCCARRLELTTFRRSSIALSRIVFLVCFLFYSGSLLQCSSTEAPELPEAIEIISGDNQFSKFGTELPLPYIVKVTTENGSPMAGVTVLFQVTAGGGSVSKSKENTYNNGLASTRLTLGPVEGINTVMAFVEGQSSKSVLFTATASYVYCPEAETTLTVSFGPEGHLLLATPKSGLYPNYSSIVRVNPFLIAQVYSFVGFPPDIFTTQLWDIAFSPRGDLYVATTELFDQVWKVAPDGSYSAFAPLDDYDGVFSAAELTCYPSGLVAGCNNKGPFIVTCGDSLLRFSEATYEGEINNDAVAVDPVTEDIFFIHNSQRALMRLPIDTLTATGSVEIVASLSTDEAIGARGMVCDSDRMIYILVDTDNTKKILKVSAVDGVKTDLFDFFTRGSGTQEEAGRQRDIALDSKNNYLYTVDTFNNAMLEFHLPSGPLNVTVQGSAISTTEEGGERVGIAVMK